MGNSSFKPYQTVFEQVTATTEMMVYKEEALIPFYEFLDSYLSRVKPLLKDRALAEWNAAITGESRYTEQAARLQEEYKRLHADKETFTQLSAWHEDNEAMDEPLLHRQLKLIYLAYAANQWDSDIISQVTKLEKETNEKYITFRSSYEGRQVSDNELLQVLKTELDSDKLRQAWEASKEIGEQVEADVRQLARLRNQAAHKLGYRDFFQMSLTLSEIKEEALFSVLNALKAETDAPFARLKGKLDAALAKRYSVPVESLMPWHYHDPFFQQAPEISHVNRDHFFEDVSLEALAVKSYEGIGLDVQDILGRSDLYEREGKYQHAFCIDIDREGDVRVICNLRPDARWASTLLHELGHAVYDKYHDPQMPYLLRQPAHTLSTEAIAMLMGRLTYNPAWLEQILGLSQSDIAQVAPSAAAQQQLDMLTFTRWALVVVHFEQAMYADPDQDLNTLWWQLVNDLQMLRKPEGRDKPDWAAKIHIALYPVYYQNYILGELSASQILHYIDANLGGLVNNPAMGQWLVERIFRPGALHPWDEALSYATGETLQPTYFVGQFAAPNTP